VYRNLGNGEFERADIGQTIIGYSGGEASWVDYDNDGFLDLLLVGQGNQLHHNNGDGTFTRVTTGSIVTERPGGANYYSYSALWFDYDNDGFLDLYVFNGNDARTANIPNFLYHNNGNNNAWLKVKLVGTASNRDGIGAKVQVQAKYAGQVRWQRRDISGGDGYNGNHLYAHFGLGNATKANVVRIEWPSGAVQEFTDVAADQILSVWEPPALSAAMKPDGTCQLAITAEPNCAWRIQASADLQTWQTLATVTNTTALFQYADAGTSGMSCRFYRVVTP
jgi:hypothetical protein